MKYLFFLFPLIAFSQGTFYIQQSDVLAFPGAEGHGKNADYGRGSSSVYFVTNTNDTGAGSLRQATLDARLKTTKAIVIFRTGGMADFDADLFFGGSDGANSGNVYFAGQTAPGGGFAIRNTSVTNGRKAWLRGSDIILRHIRSRGGDTAQNDALTIGHTTISYTMSDIIVDHCSFSYAEDENVAFATKTSANQNDQGLITNVSITNNIIAEPSGFNMIIYGENMTNLSFIKNYLALGSERHPFAQGLEITYEWINNLVYWGNDPMQGAPRQTLDLIGNYYDPGDGRVWAFSHPTFRLVDCNTSNCPPSGDSNYTGTLTYYTDNYDEHEPGDVATYNTNLSTYLQGSPNVSSGYSAIAASSVPSVVLGADGSGAGVNTSQGRDSFDTKVIADFNDRTGHTGYDTKSYPSLSAGTPYTDTDSDGLSDQYELDQGGTTTSINRDDRPGTALLSDGRTMNQQRDIPTYATTGYTHIDIFLADLAGDWDGFATEASDAVVVTTTSNNVRGSSGPIRVFIN